MPFIKKWNVGFNCFSSTLMKQGSLHLLYSYAALADLISFLEDKKNTSILFQYHGLCTVHFYNCSSSSIHFSLAEIPSISIPIQDGHPSSHGHFLIKCIAALLFRQIAYIHLQQTLFHLDNDHK